MIEIDGLKFMAAGLEAIGLSVLVVVALAGLLEIAEYLRKRNR